MNSFQLLQERAYNYLREQILSDALSYDVVYSESRFAQEIGCSRTPVKDALTRLSHAKYVDIIPSKGFMLHKLTEEDVVATFQPRVAIESFCVICVMQKRDTAEGKTAIEAMSRLVRQQQALADGSDLEQFLRLDMEFHNAIVNFVPNEDFTEAYEAHAYRIEKLAEKCLREDGRRRDTCMEHEAILQAITSGGIEACYNAVLRHNESTYQHDIMVLRRESGGKAEPKL